MTGPIRGIPIRGPPRCAGQAKATPFRRGRLHFVKDKCGPGMLPAPPRVRGLGGLATFQGLDPDFYKGQHFPRGLLNFHFDDEI